MTLMITSLVTKCQAIDQMPPFRTSYSFQREESPATYRMEDSMAKIAMDG